ncbi:putative pre-mRNA-splicing factor ATP-dependent RNA helicase C20H4.09 [Cucumispora dikerogammari]|nr:putative pre-mRNA-splicing factor ATP-dependent RNA helicase C20H4.09 [Cucumispora dikerogammari]
MYRKKSSFDKDLKKQKIESKYDSKKKKLDRRLDLINQITALDNSKLQNINSAGERVGKCDSKEKDKKFEERKKKFKDLEKVKEIKIDAEPSVNGENIYKLCGERNGSDVEGACVIDYESDCSSAVEVFKYIPLNKAPINYVDVFAQKEPDKSCTKDKNEIGEVTDDTASYIPKIERPTKSNTFRLFNRSEEVQNQRTNLPIFYEEHQIVSTIKKNPITVVSGGTGSGKSTQIPQFLLENGFENIVITQPRRIAAVSLCDRLNYELNRDLCGYKIMHESTVKKHHVIQVVTDGILLNMLRDDKVLSDIQVVIIDEFHERTINIDLLVPLLENLSKKRNLKLILMSATIDLKLPFKHKIINIESNTHKIFLHWGGETNYLIQTEKIIEKLLKTQATSINSSINTSNSHILVFLPSKKDIYGLKAKLRKYEHECSIIPLHSKLNRTEQASVFKNTNKRKIILSTNIAETSLTIPGVVFIIDSGLEKCKYNVNGVIEYRTQPISKSSAIQRMGRAGRERSGVCYRTYSREQYERMNDFSTPKILTECFDEGLLFIRSMGFINEREFKFLVVPQLQSSEKRLKDFGALNKNGEITEVGIKMSRISLSCRLSRILCSSEVTKELLLVIGVISLDIFINTQEYNVYFNEAAQKSDALAQTLMVLEIIKKDRKEAKEFETLKNFMNFYNIKPEDMNFDEQANEHIIKMIYKGFCDQLAIKHDEGYIYDGELYYLDKNSKIDSEYIVFNSIIKGKNRKYLMGASTVDAGWF